MSRRGEEGRWLQVAKSTRNKRGQDFSNCGQKTVCNIKSREIRVNMMILDLKVH